MTNAALADLAQHILDTHHAYLREHLPSLEAELRGASPELLRPLAALRFLLDEHLMKEEHILFPRFLAARELPEGAAFGVEAPIRGMWREHDQIRALEHELRGGLLLAGAHEQRLRALLDDLAVHARREDEELFAEALAREGVPVEERVPRPFVAPPPRRTATPPRMPPPAPRGGLRARLRQLLGR